MNCAILLQATKEAEHRDRLAELRARGDAARERANAEQDLILTCRLRREQADKCAFCAVLPLCASHSSIARPAASHAFREGPTLAFPALAYKSCTSLLPRMCGTLAAAAATVVLQMANVGGAICALYVCRVITCLIKCFQCWLYSLCCCADVAGDVCACKPCASLPQGPARRSGGHG